MKTIIVEVTPEGHSTITAEGFKGRGCEAATAPIEAALGQVKAKKKTPEYWQSETVAAKQKVGR
jgi:hypothetical protein